MRGPLVASSLRGSCCRNTVCSHNPLVHNAVSSIYLLIVPGRRCSTTFLVSDSDVSMRAVSVEDLLSPMPDTDVEAYYANVCCKRWLARSLACTALYAMADVALLSRLIIAYALLLSPTVACFRL